MLYNGSITEASKQSAITSLPQVIFVGDADAQDTFLSWIALNHFEQIAIISVIGKGTPEEVQLDQVVPERGITPRVHIIPPKGRGLTPTCLYNQGFAEDIVSQAIATAGGIMMSYTDVVETIAKGFVDKELRNATQETTRALAKPSAAAASPPPVAGGSSSAAAVSPSNNANSSPTARPTNVASPTPVTTTSAAPASTTKATTATAASSSSQANTAATAGASTASPTASSTGAALPNVRVSLRLADGKTMPCYTNNLWNAATQLAKGQRFALEVKNARAFTVGELQNLPLTDGTIVKLVLDPKESASSPSAVLSPTTVAAPPTTTPAASPAANTSATSSSTVDIRFTLPTGANHQLSFAPTTTLAEVRKEVSAKFLHDNKEMANYCSSNGLSNTDFTLVVAYPPKRLEDNEETNAKTLKELNLGSKFALRVVMAFLGGSAAGAPAQQTAGGTITGSVTGMFGRVGGWLRPGGAAGGGPAEE